jgi:hypothetical protein
MQQFDCGLQKKKKNKIYIKIQNVLYGPTYGKIIIGT